MEKNERNHERRATRFSADVWFKGRDEAEVKKIIETVERCGIGTTIRLGDRTKDTDSPKFGYQEGNFIELKIQNPDGSFLKTTKDLLVTKVNKKTIGDLDADDFDEAVLDGSSREEIIEKLKTVYGQDLTEEDIVTVLKFEFAEQLTSAKELVSAGALQPARLPKDNPSNLDFETYVLPLIEHDYPAKTPTMWNAAYREFDLTTGNIMLVGDPKNARQLLGVLEKDPKYLGGGAGVGFKDEASKHIELDGMAEAVGAINFILKTPEGKLRGYNTDGLGYAASLEEKFRSRNDELTGKKAVVLGAGGTSNAVAFALAEKGMKVVILNRTTRKAEELAKKINDYFGEDRASFGGEELVEQEVTDAAAVINVSTKGSAGEMEAYSALAPVTLPATSENIGKNQAEAERIFALIPKSAIVSDIVLSKNSTPFLHSAKEKGFETLDGIPMVVNQGVEAFWILHGNELAAKGITKEDVARVMKEAAK